MTQAATDTRISNSGIVTPPETITPSDANQSQISTNYDHLNYDTPRLATFRGRIEEANQDGNSTEAKVWTAARNRELKKVGDDVFEEQYGPFRDDARQSEQMSQLASITQRSLAHQLTGRQPTAYFRTLYLDVRCTPNSALIIMLPVLIMQLTL
jgi:hypothetical protein